MTYDIYHTLNNVITRIRYDDFSDIASAYRAMADLLGSATAGLLTAPRPNNN